MATASTTTLRVTTELRDRISDLAAARGVTMADVVNDAIDGLARQQWWLDVYARLDELTDADLALYRTEVEALRTTADGIG